MKRLFAILVCAMLAVPAMSLAQDKDKKGHGHAAHSEKDKQEDLARHRLLSQLHDAAAKCIESGKPVRECHEQLRKDCKGVGVGRYCGMRHQH